MPDFSKSNPFNIEANYRSVKFGAESPLLETELNEMQSILRETNKEVLKEIHGDGVFNLGTYSYSGNTLSVSNEKALVNGELITIKSASVTVNDGEDVYINTWYEEVNHTSTIKEYGNTHSSNTETNRILDVRIGVETSRREQLKFALENGVGSRPQPTYNFKIGKIAGGKFIRTCPLLTSINSEIVEGVGTLTLDNTNSGSLQDIEILGNTYQNPSNLAEIKSVGKLREDGLYEVNVKSYGKNIFNEELFINALKQQNSSKVSIVTEEEKRCVKIIDGHLFVNLKLPFHIDKNKQYTFTFTNKHITQASFVMVVDYEDGSINNFDSFSIGSFQTHSFTTKPNAIIKQIKFSYVNGGGTTFIDLDSFQIEESNVATPFEPYKETVATIKLPCQLEGIGDIKDRFYFDKEQGKWFIEKKIYNGVFDGTRGWYKDAVNHNDVLTAKLESYEWGYVGNTKFITDKFPYLEQGAYVTNAEGITSYIGAGALKLNILKTKLESLDNNGIKKFLQKNNVKFKCITSNPQLIELPLNTQVILNSFDDVTHIELDGGEIQGTIKCKVSKSLKSSVNSLVEKTDSLDNRVKQIEGLKESQSLAYQSPKGSLVCTDTKNGIIEDLKISGRTMVNVWTGFGSSSNGGTVSSDGNYLTITRTTSQGTYSPPHYYPVLNPTLKPNTKYTVFVNVIENNLGDSSLYVYAPDDTNVAFVDNYWGTIKGSDGTGIKRLTLVTKNILPTRPQFRSFIGYGDTSSEKSIKIGKITMVEGDIYSYPEYFEGIKSVGQDVDKIEILSSQIKKHRVLEKVFVNNTDLEYHPTEYFDVHEFIVPEDMKITFEDILYMKTNGLGTTIRFNDKNNNYLSTLWIPDVVNTSTFDVIVPKGCKYMGISVKRGQNPPIIKYDQEIKRSFYHNSNGDLTPLNTLREWDTIEKHSDGKYYYHKVSGETILTGDENWTVGLTGTPNFYYELPVTLTSKTGGDKVICNTLPYSGIGSSTTAMGISTTEGGRLRIRLNSEIPLADFKQWLKTNSTTVVFKAPQEEVYECVDLTLSSYEGMTNIQAISGAIKPSIEFKISSHINNVVLSNRDRINQLEALVLEQKIQLSEMEIQMLERGI